MGPPMGSDSSSGAPGVKTTNEWASPAILGMLAFGLTIILFGLSRLPHPYGTNFTGFAGIPDTELVLGGLILIIAGLIGLRTGHLYWGSAFLGYSAFWLSFGILGTGGEGFATAGFFFIWMLFTLTFLISSMKHGWVTFFFFLLLFVGVVLMLVEFWQAGALVVPGNTKISAGEMWAIGGEWILTGLVAWYSGTASLTNHTYNRKLLPA
jgi:succinate-acetate transporter protein